MADLDSALQHLLKASRVSGNKNSYKKDNPSEYGLVKAYLDGGPRPAAVQTEMGVGLREVEDVLRASGPPDPPTGSLGFYANMETTNILTQYDSMAAPAVNVGQVAPVTAENGVTPRRGEKMLRMEVRPGETAPWGSSLQAALIQKSPNSMLGVGLGFDNYQGISFYVYPGLEVLNPNMHCVLLEWHGTGQMSQAPFHFGINALNGQWFCDLHRAATGYSPIFVDSMGAHQTGVWMNVVSGIRWRSDTTGYYKLWLKQAGTGPMTDADLKVNRTGLATWNTAGASIYPCVCLYRYPFPTLGRVYFDEHRIGDSLAVVDPENYP